MTTSHQIVQKLWSYCNVLRDDGLSYQDYLEQLTFLLFLKMADERAQLTGEPQPIPEGHRWSDLAAPQMEGVELEQHYRETLRELGLQGGMLGLIFEKAQNKYPPASAFAWVSRDEGETFRPLATLWKERPITLASSTLKRLSSGRIIIPANRDESTKGQPDHWEAGACFSDDAGATWQACDNWVDAPMRGAMEPHIEELRDGRLLMAMRTQLGAVYQAHSSDGGRTWSKATSLGIEAPESCPELLRMPGTGDLVLIWNASKYDPKWYSHFGKRTPLSVAVSKDDGKTWSAPKHLESDPGWAYSNPGGCWTSRGRRTRLDWIGGMYSLVDNTRYGICCVLQ